MTVREFFTELIAQIEEMNVLWFAVVIIGLWLLIRDIRKRPCWRDVKAEWHKLSAKERHDIIRTNVIKSLVTIALGLGIVFGVGAIRNRCGGDWSSCLQTARDEICVWATKGKSPQYARRWDLSVG